MVNVAVHIPRCDLRDAVAWIMQRVRAAGGRGLLVGGCVRDACLKQPLGDIDIEVYHLDLQTLDRLLRERFDLNVVGRSFGVIKLQGLPIDIALPRRESKTGAGHRGFNVEHDRAMTFEEAAARRDFTINAMAFDPVSGELLDAFNGLRDLNAGILRHTSEKFNEDPLRVLRAMQFVARFNLKPAAETVAQCATMTMGDLARERLFEEWRKLLLLGRQISAGLAFLADCGWVRFFPELNALRGCPQDPTWHPEGDVWNHTLACMDAYAAQRIDADYENMVVGLATLCHDFGKPGKTAFARGRIRSLGHDTAGVNPARSFLTRLTAHKRMIEDILPLIRHHMRPTEFYNMHAGDTAVRRLAGRVGRIDRLVRVAEADCRGSGRSSGSYPAGTWLLKKAEALAVKDSVPKPIVQGRHLLEEGILPPGPAMGETLQRCYEAQINGRFETLADGLALARKIAGQPRSVRHILIDEQNEP